MRINITFTLIIPSDQIHNDKSDIMLKVLRSTWITLKAREKKRIRNSFIFFVWLVITFVFFSLLRFRLVRVKQFTRKYFSKNDLRKNILREKKKKIFFSVKCFTDLKSIRHFTEKWLDFPLTKKIFSVDHLFSVKQTPKNSKNIFL